MELRARGWTVAAARREVGVSRTTGANWSRGHTVRLKGGMVKFVEPLDHLQVRAISPRYLSQEERLSIADLHQSGLGVRSIAEQIGRAASTISRELRRNQHVDGSYRPFEAHRQAVRRRAKPRPRRLEANQHLRSWSDTCWRSGGARRRSPATCRPGSPVQPSSSGRCGCVTKPSIKPSTSQDP